MSHNDCPTSGPDLALSACPGRGTRPLQDVCSTPEQGLSPGGGWSAPAGIVKTVDTTPTGQNDGRACVTRSVYVTGIDRGDGRQVVDLGVMELLTRQVDRVGVFRPLVHDGPDRLFELLRARYRLSQSAETVFGLDYQEASAVQAEKGTDELVSLLVERFHQAVHVRLLHWRREATHPSGSELDAAVHHSQEQEECRVRIRCLGAAIVVDRRLGEVDLE